MIGNFIAYFAYYISPIRCLTLLLGVVSEQSNETGFSKFTVVSSYVFGIWYLVVMGIFFNGFIEIWLKFRPNKVQKSSGLAEGVSILRPLKGIDPQMVVCLESSFLQEYPVDKYELIFCIADAGDPCIPLVKELCLKYPDVDSSIMIGNDHYGPNPKINNLAKGYSLLKFDIVWVLDSNVKVRPGILQRSVDSLINSTDNGRKTSRPVKLVHHLPLAVATNHTSISDYGAQCDELFMSTAHSKFYVSINKVSLRPCVNGKSNLYRKSDLDFAVKKIGEGFTPSGDGQSGLLGRDAAYYSQQPGNNGLKLFARYIGEDNMIGIALWDHCNSRTGMTGDAVVQPLGGCNTMKDYCDRRIRWLRVRKYMVLIATLLEPTTESILSGLFGTFAISTIFFQRLFNPTLFILHIIQWFLVDRWQYLILSQFSDQPPKEIKDFTKFWLLRETLALPIWIIAMCGHSIDWRGKPFKIKRDLSAEEL